MGISNAQYDEIMRTYQQRQLHNRRVLEERVQRAYAQDPRLKEINDAIADISVSSARQLLGGDSNALQLLHTRLDALRAQRTDLLAEDDYPSDYFDPIYDCPDCKDTGYIGSEKCHCFKQAIINAVYAQSNVQSVLERENFGTFTYDYYSETDPDPVTGRTARQTAELAVAQCHAFINDFDHKPQNLFFYGETGVGKTFLSNCVAKELLDAGKSVIYFTSFQLFDILSKEVFEKDEDAISAHHNIFDCDLLIIDDLGTELPNSFTVSQLFLCVNERILRQKSTIISTNLNMAQMADVYTERTLSRITDAYRIIRLYGDDIRIRRRRRRC